ncbi:MAG TPA: DUF2069 domain-containing protein [Povalibacter sp.]|nr:DUF2069 domain-containing protein [Povalibacter sp.]
MSTTHPPAPRQRCRGGASEPPTGGIPDGGDFQSGAAAKLRASAIALTAALIALVVLWQFSARVSVERLLLSLLLTLPLWAPLRGLIRRDRRTYAWATLCVIPYFILGVTEAIANPVTRAWSATCLALALMLFVSLIGYLRATREG